MKRFAVLLFGAFAISTAAQATTWDFTAEGNRLEQGYASYVTGSGNPMPSGLTITATQDGSAAYVYMDHATSGGPGGLGVCGNLSAGKCDPASDDNQRPGETVKLDFGSTMKILDMVFTGDHGDIVAGTMLFLNVDGGGYGAGIDIGALADVGHLSTLVFLGGLMASTLEYKITGANAQVYLSALTAVPVPAALWLFGTAMFGLLGLRRKAGAEAIAA